MGEQEEFASGKLESKKVIVTGGSRGIGREIALLLGKTGYDVVLTYEKSEELAQAVVDEILGYGQRAFSLACDLGDCDSATAVMKQGMELLGGLDALVLNAGVSYMGLLSEMSVSDWDRLISVNLSSLFYCSKAVIPCFVSQKRGSIVTLSSMWGQVGGSCEVAYSASKAGVIGFTKALAKELAPSGITVNCVAPGVIETDMISMLTEEDKICLIEEIPLGRLGTGGEVARVVAFLLEDSAYLTGQVFAPNGGINM